MKFNLLREDLLPALQLVNSVVDRRQNLPILSNLLLKLSSDTISVTATDMEVEMKCSVQKATDTNGQITVPARKFLDICRSLPDEAEINFETNEEKLVLKSGKSRFTLVTQPAEEFPETDFLETKTEFTISQLEFHTLIHDTMFAMAQQDVRYYLNGMLLEFEKETLRAVATDGHRLALKEIKCSLPTIDKSQLILPRKTVQELIKIISQEEQDMVIQLTANHIRFKVGNTVLTSKLIDGKFPEYQRVIPETIDTPLIADKETLKQSLTRASILSNEKYRGVRITIEENKLKAEAQNPEQEQAEEEIEANYSGPTVEIGFNVSYLLDAINAIKTDTVKILIFDANSSCLILPDGDSTCKYVVMPMRL